MTNRLKILSVVRTHSQAKEIHLDRDSKALKDFQNSSSEGNLEHHLSGIYSMSSKKCLVVKEDQEGEVNKSKQKVKM